MRPTCGEADRWAKRRLLRADCVAGDSQYHMARSRAVKRSGRRGGREENTLSGDRDITVRASICWPLQSKDQISCDRRFRRTEVNDAKQRVWGSSRRAGRRWAADPWMGAAVITSNTHTPAVHVPSTTVPI
ncbi:hypothetical protein E2C01_035294 [Portunus trituberculatus]|uniref:Uncharacterized protein n=1 Tax=Portunus trituberculatus TaxID=210409 RepID=A0A5B7FB34_PORTR|nr:hypothetical protein [Portunus trituberculatus]